MQRGSVQVFRIFGIPIHIHLSWLFIFALITWALGSGYFPRQYPEWTRGACWLVGLATSLLFFVSVLLHELAHSVVAVARGMEVRDIVLFVFGGVSEIADEPLSAGTEFLMTLVGPMTSFALGALSWGVYKYVGPVNVYVGAAGRYLAFINVLLGAFNLIPGFPLDGGRLLRALIWAGTHDIEKATRWATRMGILISYAFIAFGIWAVLAGNVEGLWYALIGWFLNNAAQTSYSRTMLKRALMGHTVRQVMSADCPQISPDLSVEQVVHDFIIKLGSRCLPVVEDGRAIGIVTVHSIKGIPRERWPQIPVREAMIPMDKVQSTGPDKGLWAALQEMTGEGVNQLPVVEDGRLVGMLRRDAVMSFLRTRAELGV